MLLNELTISQAHDGLKKKDFSSVELTKACLEQIKKTDDKIKAFITVTEDLALQQAQAADQKGDFLNPLAGIPNAIKDCFCTKGVKSTAGSKILENYVPPYSATSIEKLEANDSVMLGKVNLDEFTMGSSCENSGFFPTKNPWDLARVPGGSSGGSAAAVTANQCLYALGTDTGGSIREPASFCGITGLKVTYGRVSRYGVMSYASSFDTIGALTKNVEDAALVLNAIAGSDPKDSTTPPVAVPNYSEELKKDIKGLKIGVPKEYFVAGMDPAVEKTIRQAIAKFEELGAKVTEVSLPLTKYAIATYYILVKSEASTNLARYDGVRYGLSAKADTLLENYLQTRAAGFGPEVKRSIMMGTYTLSAGYYDAYYLKAAKVRTLIKQDFEKVLNKVDCLMTPVAPTVAFQLGEKVDDPLTMYLADIFTISINIAGVPALSIPCGFVKPKDGKTEMPVGLQIIGKQFDEPTILRVGYNYEQATEWHKQKPSLK
ncbi:MAG: Asp-tRNA(Asn)/Glu-tRNA(Gln) amidotransferase subunit GatA [Patescibacteria group bacterium]|jgi:aspartyl-tRNA(Asn)/glutamyl-tRNA(Gln) amidotransferase subunit A